MCGIHPGVRIMKIQQQISPCLFDALAQCGHKSQVLTNGGVEGAVLVCFGRVDEDTHAESVPSAIRHGPCDKMVDLGATHIFVVR